MTQLRNTMQTAALNTASRYDWFLFPAKFVGKQKLGYTSADKSNGNNWGYTKNPDEILAYWRRWPNAAIGLPTGAVNGLFVIDVDTTDGHEHDGRESLNNLTMLHGDLPRTRMAESPTGSQHYYFKQPSGLVIPSTAGKLALGIDVRGDGGFVIAPPSVRPNRGAYTWISHCVIASAPKWLLALVVPSTTVAKGARGHHLKSPHDPTPCNPEIDAILEKYAGSGVSTDPDDVTDPRLEIEVALSRIPIDADTVRHLYGLTTEQLWYKVGSAIYDGLGDDGFEVFDDWSQTSPHYKAADCAYKWRHVCKMRREIKVATIFYYANKYDPGWRELHRQILSGEVAI